jgi:hypothetical protein
MIFKSVTLLSFFALANAEKSIHGAENRQLPVDDLLGLLPSGVIDNLISKDLLKSTFQPVLQQVLGSQFTIDGETIREEDLHSFSVYSNPTEESHLFKAEVTGGTVFVSKVDGEVISAVKVGAQSGEIVQLANLASDIFTTFSTSDLDKSKVQQFEYGPDLLGPDDRRGLESITLGEQARSSTARNLAACEEFTVIRLSLKFDSQFCKEHGSAQAQVRAHIEGIVATASSFYQAEGLCKKIEICDLEGFCNDNGSDTYRDMVTQTSAVCGESNDLLTTFTSYIQSNSPSQCDNYHLLYGNEPDGSDPYETTIIGCAYTRQMCNNYATGVNYYGFTNNAALQATLLAHELGHNIGSGHSPAEGPFPREFIMEPYICDCRKFDASSATQINDFVASRQSTTCTRTEGAGPSTAPPTPAPSTPAPSPTGGGCFLPFFPC